MFCRAYTPQHTATHCSTLQHTATRTYACIVAHKQLKTGNKVGGGRGTRTLVQCAGSNAATAGRNAATAQ